MRLKRIELNGFKSFPDRTVISLESGITALVGPNGCGKSNVVDAIRWCMGETNARRLRGDVLEDLIFCGGDGRKPVGMAEVTLVLSPDGNGGFPPEYAQEEELVIRRRLFRDGTSEFSVNGFPCRLRDITEIFMDTGSGSRAYSLIEQNDVTALIEARPEERRVFLEQVAGIGKYRSRVQEATRRMTEAQNNLNRVNDMLREIRRRLKILEEQARQAEAGKKLREELQNLGLSLDQESWRNLGAQMEEIVRQREELETQEVRIRTELTAMEALASEKEVLLGELAEKMARIHQERESLKEQARALEMEYTALSRDQENRQTECSRKEGEIQELKEKLTRIQEELRLASQRAREIELELASKHQELVQGEEELRIFQEQVQELMGQQENFQNQLFALMEEEAQLKNREVKLGEKIRSRVERQEKITQEMEEVKSELVNLEAQEAILQDFEEKERQRLLEIEAQREEILRARESLAKVEEELGKEIVNFENELISLKATLQALGEEENLGVESGEKPAGGMRLSALLEVEPELETAVAGFLGEKLSAWIVPDWESGIIKAQEQTAGKGKREIFLPQKIRKTPSLVESSLENDVVPLLDRISCSGEYREMLAQLFRGVYLVPSLSRVRELIAENHGGATFVTPYGEVVYPSGEVIGGVVDPKENQLVRQRRIREIRQRFREIEAELEKRRGQKEESLQVKTSLEDRLRQVSGQLEEGKLARVRREKENEALRQERSRLERKKVVLAFELDILEREREEEQREADEIGSRREEIVRRRGEEERRYHGVQEKMVRLRSEMVGKEAEITRRKVEMAALKERYSAQEKLDKALEKRVEELQQEILSKEAFLSSSRELTEKIQSRQEEIREKLGQIARRLQEIETQVREEERAYQEGLSKQKEAQEKIRELRRGREEVEKRLEEVRSSEVRIRIEMEGIATRIQERYGREPDSHFSSVYDELPREERERRIAELKVKIEELGEVNQLALREYEETKQQHDFLNRQREDLSLSLSRLQRAIARMNKTSREKLLQAFSDVQKSFREVFPRLFKGGEGDLVWVGEDPLEAGIDVVAKPPGKRPRVVSLLSGGEKALAAVAFLIACFLARPAPFCVLDEVDAPLDEANIARFNQLIRELADRAQFILITHNRRTMEMADVLYGVTMETPGVSKLVSVKLN